MSETNGYVQFVHDDEAYRRWLTKHHAGYVVNSFKVPTSDYLIFHRASCKSISDPAGKNWTTTGYIKTCSTNPSELVKWAYDQTGGSLHSCGLCRPANPGRLNVEPTPTRSAPIRATSTPPPFRADEGKQSKSAPGSKTIPPTIATGCLELDRAWASYASMILDRSQILIPDTDEDLTWHAFLGHSVDMQGFRAAEFAGVDKLTRNAPRFVPLKERGIGVPELAALWKVLEIKAHLLGRLDGVPLETTLEVLRSHGGRTGNSLTEAFEQFPWRKFHWSVRALLQNSATLQPFQYSFREWLRNECNKFGLTNFPPLDFRRDISPTETPMSLERALRTRLEQSFYMVGPAMSAYMLCDWQLWLWKQGKTTVFANFKLDSFHEEFIKKFSHGEIPADEAGFTRWWFGLFPELPPRLANECIWLAVENKQVNPWPA